MIKKFIIFLLILIIIILISIIEHNFDKHNYINVNKKYLKYQNKILDPSLVKKGMIEAKNNKIIIAGLARNCEKNILNNIKFLEILGSNFKDYNIVIFENDSSDNTRNILKKCEIMNNKIHLIKCKDNVDCKFKSKKGYEYGQFSKSRLYKMAVYREYYLDFVKKSNSKYTIVIDLDLDLKYINTLGLMYTLSTQDKWNGIFINCKSSLPFTFGSLNIPYDALAYASENTNYDLYKKSYFKKYAIFYYYILLLYIYNQNNIITPVKSAFNGLALYKTEALKKCSYVKDFDGTYCEHIHLHRQMDNLYAANKWVSYQPRQGDGNPFNQFINLLKS